MGLLLLRLGNTPSLYLALAWHAIAFLVYFGMFLAKPHEFLEG